MAQRVQRRIGTPLSQVRFSVRRRIFLPQSASVQTLLRFCTPPHTIAYTDICEHVKNPVVHVTVRWIMATLKHPACTVGWVARLCRSWLSPGKANRISYGRISSGTIQLLRKKKKKKEAVHASPIDRNYCNAHCILYVFHYAVYCSTRCAAPNTSG